MQEEWASLCVAPKYQVSTLGRVRHIRTGRILKPYKTLAGYLNVTLQAAGGQVSKSVHRLIAETFLPVRDVRMSTVNHKDLVRDHNTVDNLEWMTPAAQNHHKLQQRSTATDRFQNKSRAVWQMCAETGNDIELFPSATRAAHVLVGDKLLSTMICAVCRGRGRAAFGFAWRYAESIILPGEEWKEVAPAHLHQTHSPYSVSTAGRIRNRFGRVWGGTVDAHGYPVVKLADRHFRLHRLIALTFIPNPENLPYVDHISGEKTDCRVANLDWVTPKQNTQRAMDTGCFKDRLVAVQQFDMQGSPIHIHPSLQAAAEASKAHISAISLAYRGLRRSAGGFIWRPVSTD